MAGSLITGLWQIERNDILMGDGTPYDIRRIDGLADQPATVSSSRAVALRHGHLEGRNYLSPRSIVVTFEVVDDDTSTMSTKLDTLARALAPSVDPVPTVFKIPGVAAGSIVIADMHVTRRAVPIDLTYSRGVATAAYQLSAADPRLYSLTLNSAAVGAAPAATPGLTPNVSFNMTFGGAISPGSVSVSNLGSFGSWPTFRIDGPVTDPVVTNLSTGEALSFTTTLTGSQYLLVDTAARTVLLDGTSNRYSALDAGSTWFALAPGVNDLRLSITGSDAATLTVFYRDAYI